MEDAKLQVRIDKELLKKAEDKSKKDGFDSLPSLTRFLLNSYIKGSLNINLHDETAVNINKSKEYAKEKRRVDALTHKGRITYKDTVDDFIDSLDSEESEEVISFKPKQTKYENYSINEELDTLKYTVAELQAEYQSLSKIFKKGKHGSPVS